VTEEVREHFLRFTFHTISLQCPTILGFADLRGDNRGMGLQIGSFTPVIINVLHHTFTYSQAGYAVF